MLVLTRAEVQDLLDLDALVDAVAAAMVDASRGTASMPPRIAALVPEQSGLVAAMPAYLPSTHALTVKLVSLFPRNTDPVPTHQAVIVAFDPATGTPVALMDGTHITAARTAAGSALAARLLARPDAAVLAILGTGVQARAHAHALPRVRPIREIRVAGRRPAAVEALAHELAGALPALRVRASASYQEAMAGADVVAATTHAAEPVVHRSWLAPGTHVSSVGFNREGREVDGETVRDALVVVETRAAALAPYPSGANDLLWAIRDGLIDPGHVHAELGEICAGTRPARTSPDQITLYKSVGVAVQDAAAAALVLAAARTRRLGRTIPL